MEYNRVKKFKPCKKNRVATDRVKTELGVLCF